MPMKSLAVAGLSAGVWLAAITAGAAQAQTVRIPYNGPYVGIDLGGAVGNSKKDFILPHTVKPKYDVSGIIGGADAGYDWRAGKLVFGVVGDISGSGVSGSTVGLVRSGYVDYKTNNDWLGTLRPRICYLLGASTLPYITGGLAVGDIGVHSFFTATGGGGVDYTRVEPGWTVGAGIQTGFMLPNLSLKAEYLHVQLSDADVPSNVGTPTRVSFNENIFRAGLDYAF